MKISLVIDWPFLIHFTKFSSRSLTIWICYWCWMKSWSNCVIEVWLREAVICCWYFSRNAASCSLVVLQCYHCWDSHESLERYISRVTCASWLICSISWLAPVRWWITNGWLDKGWIPRECLEKAVGRPYCYSICILFCMFERGRGKWKKVFGMRI